MTKKDTALATTTAGLKLETVDEAGRFAQIAIKSGFFRDMREAASGIIKVQWGMELGVGPVTALTGIHNIQGKLAMSATLMASLIQRHPRYKYTAKMSNECVTLTCFVDGEEVGESSFSMADAKSAGVLGNPTWKKYPRNMMFARAIANAARWFFADVFHGAPAYVPEELGADVDGEGEPVEIVSAQNLDEKMREAVQAAAPEPEPEEAEFEEVVKPEPVKDGIVFGGASIDVAEVGVLKDYILAVRKCETEDQLKETVKLGAKLKGCSEPARDIAKWEFNLAMATARGDDAKLIALDQNPRARGAWAAADQIVEAS